MLSAWFGREAPIGESPARAAATGLEPPRRWAAYAVSVAAERSEGPHPSPGPDSAPSSPFFTPDAGHPQQASLAFPHPPTPRRVRDIAMRHWRARSRRCSARVPRNSLPTLPRRACLSARVQSPTDARVRTHTFPPHLLSEAAEAQYGTPPSRSAARHVRRCHVCSSARAVTCPPEPYAGHVSLLCAAASAPPAARATCDRPARALLALLRTRRPAQSASCSAPAGATPTSTLVPRMRMWGG